MTPKTVEAANGHASDARPTPEEVKAAIEKQTAYLLAKVPGLMHDEALELVTENVEHDLEQPRSIWNRINELEWPRMSTVHTAKLIVEERFLAMHHDTLQRIHQQTQKQLRKEGLSFDWLEAYHRRNKGKR